MVIRSRLPLNRWLAGTVQVEDEGGNVVLGPLPCRGKADSQRAAAHGNPERYPTLPFGDHPSGTYAVAAEVPDKAPRASYGPFFLLLDPVAGDALRAKENGRTGLAIHGGDPDPKPGPYGPLRATEGCLRVSNGDVAQIAALVRPGDTYVAENA
jgi:hypothetical protein